MASPNLNTFSPTQSVEHTTFSLPTFHSKQSVAIIGAGAFGSWAAIYLLRKGFKVTLIDAWGAGNSRSSSGDETRVIRSTYGSNEFYFNLNARALELWKENQQRFNKKLFQNTGVLWFCYDEKTPLVDESVPYAKKHNMNYEYLDQEQISKRFPIVNVNDLHHAYLDPFGGYLKARESCIAVKEAFEKEGGRFIQAAARPGNIHSKLLCDIVLSNGEHIKTDFYIFACGAWLNELFPEVLSNIITCTKQEVYYFGVPEKQSMDYDDFPVWIDADGKDFYYGIAGNASRGFKIGVDKRGAPFNPTSGPRTIDHAVFEEARDFLYHRFPGLRDAPLLESRVCPYENSQTGNFLFDLHPDTENLFFLGGGSGHGFKHSPALGELVSAVLTGKEHAPSFFRLTP